MTDEKTVPLVKRMRLRNAVCAGSGRQLAAGAPAHYERASKTVSCLVCTTPATAQPSVHTWPQPIRRLPSSIRRLRSPSRARPRQRTPRNPRHRGWRAPPPGGSSSVDAPTGNSASAPRTRGSAASSSPCRMTLRAPRRGPSARTGKRPWKATRRPGEPHRAGPARPTHTPHQSQHRPHRGLSHGGAVVDARSTPVDTPEGGGGLPPPRTERPWSVPVTAASSSTGSSSRSTWCVRPSRTRRSRCAGTCASSPPTGRCSAGRSRPRSHRPFAQEAPPASSPTGSAQRGRDPPSARSSGDRVPVA